MAINTTTINGDVFLPDGSVREKSYVIFEQTGFDTDNVDDAVIVTFPIRAAIAVDGSIDVDLWPNQDGVRSTFYRVTFEIYNGTAKHLVDGGKISVPASGGPYALNDLLPVSPPAGATVGDYIAYLEAAVASAEAAAASIVGASDLLFTPESFGAVGDGVTDDTSAMQQFFAAVEGGVGNLSNDAVYVINSRIFPPSKNWTLNANGAKFDYSGMPNGDGDSAGSLLSIAGSVDTTIGLTSITEVADAFGQVVTTVVSDTAHGLSVGDDVLLSSDDVIDAGHNLTQETRGQYVRVDTVVSATEFTANQPIYEALTTNPVMTRINWAENIHINGPLTIKGAGRRPTAIGYSGLAFTYARDCSVSDLTTDLVDYQAFSRDNCLRVNAGQLTFKFAPKGASTATQYGDTFKNASTDCRTGGILSYGGKHAFDWTRNTNPGVGRNCVIGPIVGYDGWDALAATHGNSRDLKFSTIKAINCLYAFGSRVAGVRVDELYGEDCYEVLKITDDTRNLSVGSVRAKNCSFVVRAKDTEWIGTFESRNIHIGRVEADGVLQNTIYLDWSDIPVINETDSPVTGGSSNTITMGAFPQTNYNYSGALIGSQIIMDWDGAGGGTAQTRAILGHTWSGTTNTITVSSWTVAPVAGTSTYKIRSFVDDISIGDVVSKNCAGADVFINGNVRRLVIGDLDIISEGINANPAVLISATADSYPDVVSFGRLRKHNKAAPAISTLAKDVTFKDTRAHTPSPKDFGAVMDGITDDTSAFEALVSTGAPVLDFGSGHSILSRQITLLPTTKIVRFGNLKMDYTGVVSVGSGFPNGAGVYFEGDARVTLPNLSVSPVEQATTLTFASAPNVVVGDIIEISDPTDFSFSGFRDYYRNGIRCEVRSISGSVVELVDPIISAFDHTVVNVAKFPKSSIKFKGERLHIAVNSLINWGVLVRRGYDIDYSNVSGTGAQFGGIAGREVQKVRGTNVIGRQDDNVSNNTQYGGYFVCAQDLDMDGEWSGEQHGFTLSGGGNDVEIPNRWCRVRGRFTNLDTTSPTLGAFSPHGNSEFWEIDGDFFGGVNFGGDFSRVRGNVYASGSSECTLMAQELLGFNHDMSGVKIINGPGVDPVATSRGVIDIAYNSGDLTANTVRGGVLNLDNVTVYAPDATDVLRARNAGCVQDIRISMRGFRILDCTGSRIGRFLVASGSNFNTLDIHGCQHPSNLSWIGGSNIDRVRGWSVSGRASLTPTLSNSIVALAETYDLACPKTPQVTVGLSNSVGASGERFVAGARNTTAAGFDLLLATASGNNFAATGAETLDWHATLDET